MNSTEEEKLLLRGRESGRLGDCMLLKEIESSFLSTPDPCNYTST